VSRSEVTSKIKERIVGIFRRRTVFIRRGASRATGPRRSHKWADGACLAALNQSTTWKADARTYAVKKRRRRRTSRRTNNELQRLRAVLIGSVKLTVRPGSADSDDRRMDALKFQEWTMTS